MMTITIETPTDIEAAIARGAAREGVTPQEYALRALMEKARAEEAAPLIASENEDIPRQFPPGTTYHGVPVDGNPLASLFAQWAADDPIIGSEDLAQRQREGDEFMAGLRENRFNIPQDPRLVTIIESMSDEPENDQHDHNATT